MKHPLLPKKIQIFTICNENAKSLSIPFFNSLKATSKANLVNSRIGQGKYRREILSRWGYRCAVTQTSIIEILIASHILAWKSANDVQRLDVENGILLAPNYDAAFDKHLISFDDNGKIILSNKISIKEFNLLGITGKERICNLSEGNKFYLSLHRENLY